MLSKKAVLTTVFTTVLAGELFAGTLTSYTVGDVLLCFRKSGGANDLVVDAGPVSTFTNAAVNQRITITQFTGSQLALVGTNSVSWSAFTWFDDSVTPASSQWTLFASKARTSLGTQTTAWSSQPAASQQLAAGDMSTIPPGTVDAASYNALNSSTAVIEPDDTQSNPNPLYKTGQSYDGALQGGSGNSDFGGDFTGKPENTTAANFTTASAVVRSDFYQIPPKGSGAVRFLGYFEFNTNGVMTYVAYPSLPTTPVIKSITRTNTITYVSFSTGTSGTYTLRGTNMMNSGVAPTNWPAITSMSGNGLTNTLTDTTSMTNKFYIITAQ